MHFIVRKAFQYGSTQYSIGDGIYNGAYSSLIADPYFNYYSFFVVPVSDGETVVINGGAQGGVSDMPFAAGYYVVPAGASTSGIFSANPVRILSITNTDTAAQGAVLNLFDTNIVSNITTAHKLGSWQLGASQIVERQFVTTIGLVWEITQGDGTNSTSNNASGTAMNSTGGIDIDYANV